MKRVRIRKLILWGMVVAVVASLLSVAGCTSKSSSTASSPSIVIAAPQGGTTVPAGDITVSVQVSHLSLVDKVGKANVKGEGHVIYAMDVEPSTTAGKSAVPATGRWSASAATSYTFANVSAGAHRFYVELVNNNNTPLNPLVSANVSVTVAAPPAPAPATPLPPAETPGPAPAQTTSAEATGV